MDVPIAPSRTAPTPRRHVRPAHPRSHSPQPSPPHAHLPNHVLPDSTGAEKLLSVKGEHPDSPRRVSSSPTMLIWCLSCSPACATCTGPSPSQCLSCAAPRVNMAGSCVGYTAGDGICDSSLSGLEGVFIVNNDKSKCDGEPPVPAQDDQVSGELTPGCSVPCWLFDMHPPVLLALFVLLEPHLLGMSGRLPPTIRSVCQDLW